jgi:hypothetical protein
MTTAKTCDKCNAVLPTDAQGRPRYWNTVHLNPTTRIPRGLHICAACRTDQSTLNPATAAGTAALQPVLI